VLVLNARGDVLGDQNPSPIPPRNSAQQPAPCTLVLVLVLVLVGILLCI
jgi:hypothetical protein